MSAIAIGVISRYLSNLLVRIYKAWEPHGPTSSYVALIAETRLCDERGALYSMHGVVVNENIGCVIECGEIRSNDLRL